MNIIKLQRTVWSSTSLKYVHIALHFGLISIFDKWNQIIRLFALRAYLRARVYKTTLATYVNKIKTSKEQRGWREGRSRSPVGPGIALRRVRCHGYAMRMRSEIPHKFLLNFEEAIAEEDFFIFIYEDAVTVEEPKILRNFRIMRKRKRNPQQP